MKSTTYVRKFEAPKSTALQVNATFSLDGSLCSTHILTFAKKFVGTYMFATDEKMIPHSHTQKSSCWVTSMRYLMLQTLQLEKICPN